MQRHDTDTGIRTTSQFATSMCHVRANELKRWLYLLEAQMELLQSTTPLFYKILIFQLVLKPLQRKYKLNGRRFGYFQYLSCSSDVTDLQGCAGI